MRAETLRAILALAQENAHERRTCSDYEKFFSKLAREQKERGDLAGADSALLIGGICSMMLNESRTGNPWGPVLIDYKAGRRSVEADDLEKEQLDALGELAREIEDPELRSRIADILWTRNQGYEFGQIAIAAYTEDDNRPISANRPQERISRLERALNIARRLGRKKPLHLKTFETLERLIEELETDQSNASLLPHLLDVIFDHQLGDPAKYIAMCEAKAVQASLQKEWDLAARFWELASSWHHRQGQEEQARGCRQAAAKELIARGRDAEGRQRYGCAYSAGWILRGLTALKNSGGEKAEIEALNSELAEVQKGVREDVQTFTFDPRDSVEGYEEGHAKHVEMLKTHLSGKSLQDAIVLYCGLAQPTDVENLKSTIREGGNGFFTQMIGMVATDTEGKETDRAEGIGWNGEVAEADLLKRLYEHARTTMWPMACEWLIEPGRRIIAAEHAPRIKDLVFLISNNPFVPPGHERIFLRGIHAGFEGDFLLATHLLIPQFESSLSRYLKQCGVVTWVLKDGLQKELDLGGLLALPRTKELLGDDLVFDLRGILTEKFGENLRNEMAHGKMPEAAFFHGAGPLYFWWLFLRMVWIASEAGNAADPDGSSRQ